MHSPGCVLPSRSSSRSSATPARASETADANSQQSSIDSAPPSPPLPHARGGGWESVRRGRFPFPPFSVSNSIDKEESRNSREEERERERGVLEKIFKFPKYRESERIGSVSKRSTVWTERWDPTSVDIRGTNGLNRD